MITKKKKCFVRSRLVYFLYFYYFLCFSLKNGNKFTTSNIDFYAFSPASDVSFHLYSEHFAHFVVAYVLGLVVLLQETFFQR